VIVVDASVIAPALTDDGVDGNCARDRLRGERLLAPELLDLEVVSVIRRALSIGAIDERRASFALNDLFDLDLERVIHRPLLGRIWELRANVTPYDAAYIALAEAIDAPMVTADRRLARAPMVRCQVEYIGSFDLDEREQQ
jgi:predicted nucleic acid-binding protein